MTIKLINLPKSTVYIFGYWNFDSDATGFVSVWQTDAEFSELSLHEATPEEKEEAEGMKNKGRQLITTHKLL